MKALPLILSGVIGGAIGIGFLIVAVDPSSKWLALIITAGAVGLLIGIRDSVRDKVQR